MNYILSREFFSWMILFASIVFPSIFREFFFKFGGTGKPSRHIISYNWSKKFLNIPFSYYNI